MRPRSSWRRWLLLLALTAVGASALWLRHGRGARGEQNLPLVVTAAAKEGVLWVGAARAELHPPYPVVVAGYAPPRPTARSSARPLYARALVLRVGDLKIGLVALDLLLVPEPLADEVRSLARGLGLTQLLVTATHTHSSLGGYDPGLLVQFAGTGFYRSSSRSAVLAAASAALSQASATLTPVTLEAGERAFPSLVFARTEGPEPDGLITRMLFKGEHGAVAQWLVFGAHPTLIPRPAAALDPDFPGAISQSEEQLGHGITLLTQGAEGNVSAASGEDPPRASRFSSKLASALEQVPVTRVVPVRLAISSVSVPLPATDASRLVPGFLRPMANQLLSWVAPERARLSELELGPVRLVFLPGEPTSAAEKVLRQATGGARSVALADGYLGYIEAPELVLARQGEYKRQYFSPELLNTMVEAVHMAQSRLHASRAR